jgi:hypothetical protein
MGDARWRSGIPEVDINGDEEQPITPTPSNRA